MAIFCEVLAPTKSERRRAYTFEALTADAAPLAGILTLTDSRTHTRYAVEEFPADVGRGFVLKKAAGAGHYSCNVAGENGLCECRGFEAHGRCKHLDALRDLIACGKL